MKNKRYKLIVGGEVERTCTLLEVNRLLAIQAKAMARKEKKVIIVSDTVTAVRIG